MYQLTNSTSIIRISDGKAIPMLLLDPDYEEYLLWVESGNTPLPFIPTTVTRFQALAILAAGGYLDTVRTYINTLDPNNVQRLAWENATDWERTSPTLNALAQMLNLTSAEVDDLFVAASQVSA